MKKRHVEHRFLDMHEAAEYLGIAYKGLSYRVQTKQVPFTRLGSSLRFDRIELDKMLAKNAVPPIDLSRR